MKKQLILSLIQFLVFIKAELDSWQYLNKGGKAKLIAANTKALYTITKDDALHVLELESDPAGIGTGLQDVKVNEENGLVVVGLNEKMFVRIGITSANPQGDSWIQMDGSGLGAAFGRSGLLFHYNSEGGSYIRTGITSSQIAGTGWQFLAPDVSKMTCSTRVCFTVFPDKSLFTSGIIPSGYSPTLSRPLKWQKIRNGVAGLAASDTNTLWVIDEQGDAWKAENVYDNDMVKLKWARHYYNQVKLKHLAVTKKIQFAIDLNDDIRVGTGCPIFDFEEDDISKWTQTGTAFLNQPVVSQRQDGILTGKVGDRLIDTYFSRKNDSIPESVPEATAGFLPTGTLTSPEFEIRTGVIHFLVGGGDRPANYAALFVDGVEIMTASGANKLNNGPNGSVHAARYWWDVTPYEHKCAQIKLVDEGTATRTIFDDVRTAPPCHKNMDVTLLNLDHDGTGTVGNRMKFQIQLRGFYTSKKRPLSISINFPVANGSSFLYIRSTKVSMKCGGSVETSAVKNSTNLFSKRWHTVTLNFGNYLLSDGEVRITTRIYDHQNLQLGMPKNTTMTVSVNYMDELLMSIDRQIEIKWLGNETANLVCNTTIVGSRQYFVGENVTFSVHLDHDHFTTRRRAFSIMLRLFLPPYMSLLSINGTESDLGETTFSPSPSQHVVHIPELQLRDSRSLVIQMGIDGDNILRKMTRNMEGQFLVDEISYCKRPRCLNAEGDGIERTSLQKNQNYRFLFSYKKEENSHLNYSSVVVKNGTLRTLCGQYTNKWVGRRAKCYYGNTTSNSWHSFQNTISQVSHFNAAKNEFYGSEVGGAKVRIFGEGYTEHEVLEDSQWNNQLISDAEFIKEASGVHDIGQVQEEQQQLKHQLNCCKKETENTFT
ncbi:uncharacterized protein LOC135690908 [Rhopilema esculentum]|uniref:uncharacterized protein LOC135690908 n=1 Tax=Rhopilema esculentum TaxID=499914 RepID=UPI0031DC100A|eukprot:gene1185-15547_t